MRLHITIDDDIVKELDEEVGPRGRSAFIVRSLLESLDRRRRLRLMQSAFGSISDEGHVWDPDPAKWVHDERRRDPRRVG